MSGPIAGEGPGERRASGLAEAPALAFLEAELAAARQHVGELSREVERLRDAVYGQQQTNEQLQQVVVTLEGRTRRHEHGQDIAASLREEFALLREQVAAEAELRRERARAQAEEQGRERDGAAGLGETLVALQARLDALEQRVTVGEQRHREHTTALAEQARTQAALEGRVDEAHGELDALRDRVRTGADEQARLRSALPELVDGLRAVEAKADVVQQAQLRTDEAVGALRAMRDRELDLLEAIEQTRAARHRFEERLAAQDERIGELEEMLREAAEDRLLVRQQAASALDRTQSVTHAVDEQRDLLLGHLRRLTQASEQESRRRLDEIRRQNQASRQLLTRFIEEAQEAGREQPL